ncbi:hypothetical protein BGW39_001905 [Mortierella sp. 14UC]|nr:hypothetical protein BGW39_001905 [Mortierella sp. 14UC]
MAAGYSYTRSIRSFADIWALMPTVVVVPVAIIGLVLKTCIRSVCCCCFASKDNTSISDLNRAVMEDEIQQKMKAKNVKDVFEAWPKWPNYTEDDPLAIKAAEPASEQLCEIELYYPKDISPSSRPTTMSFVSEPPTLATKLGVAHLDLSNTHEESYGYDMTRQRIRYHRNSWSFKCRVFLAVYHQLVSDIVVCIVIPLLAFLLLFFAPAQNRAYDVYPNHGGCRVSSNGALADWVRTVVLQVLLTLIAALGLLFSILSIFQFKKQHGALSFKMKSLSPSPAVLRLYKSTEIVKNILMFCVGMNAVQFLGRVIYISLRISKYDPSRTTVGQEGLQRLFRHADHDRDKRASGAPSQATRTASLSPSRHLSPAKNDAMEETELERLERLPGLRVGIVEPSMVISIGNERHMNNLNGSFEGIDFFPPFEDLEDLEDAQIGRQTPQ